MKMLPYLHSRLNRKTGYVKKKKETEQEKYTWSLYNEDAQKVSKRVKSFVALKKRQEWTKEKIARLNQRAHPPIEPEYEHSWTYVAGMFDGDSSVMFSGLFRLGVALKQKYKPICDLLEKFHGGRAYPKNGGTFVWVLSKKEFLLGIIDHVRGKK